MSSSSRVELERGVGHSYSFYMGILCGWYQGFLSNSSISFPHREALKPLNNDGA